MNISVVMSNRVQDARAAMQAIVASRSLPINESEPGWAAAVAEAAWLIADAMADQRGKRSGKQTIPPPPSKRGSR